ncbi:substrate-binding domain-containing protein [Pseudarthrobacter sp. J1763]|uniref:substrate-binding domain-containing protein n=1 Tax=Pseudarthrobacter sp. J1763 TaxID=3420445 RepID=UPI003D2BDC16
MSEPTEETAPSVRFAYAPGVTPGKWIRRWEERMRDVPLSSFMSDAGTELAVLRDGSADLSFVRLPIERDGLNVIPLYAEQPVVVAAKGHEITAFEEVDVSDLVSETMLDSSPEGLAALGGVEMALQVVASGAGLLVLPMAVARHFNAKETLHRRLTGAPETEIAVVWLQDRDNEFIQEFVGIVRGRTAQSSRQPSSQKEEPKKAPKARTPRGPKKPSVAQRYAPNPDKGRGKGSRKRGKK